MSEGYPGLSGFHPLGEGIDAYAARLLLVNSAQKSLDLQYYIWHDDLTGKVLHNAILKTADRGVRVRLLLDDLDTSGKDELLHIIDAHPNIEIRLFNPFANRGTRVGDFLTDLDRVNHRMHNKSLTADNQATILGGRNIGDEYFSASEEVGFADMDVLALGPIAKEVSQAFDLYWNSEWVYPLAAFTPDRPITDERVKAFRRQSDAYLQTAKTSSYAAAIRALDVAKSGSLAGFDYSWCSWKLIYDHPSKVQATKISIDTHLGPKLKQGLAKTRSDLIIVSPYFVPGSDFTEYLIALVHKGVRVRIMTNSLAANDVSVVHAGYMRYRKDLVAGGIELFELKPNANRGEKTEKTRHTGSSRASLHGKFFGFDRRYLFVGSFNLDARSVALNTEMGAFFESPTYAEVLDRRFDAQAMTRGYKVVLDKDGELEWITLENGREIRFNHEPQTGFWRRFSTGFLSLFVPESQL